MESLWVYSYCLLFLFVFNHVSYFLWSLIIVCVCVCVYMFARLELWQRCVCKNAGPYLVPAGCGNPSLKLLRSFRTLLLKFEYVYDPLEILLKCRCRFLFFGGGAVPRGMQES